MKLFNLLRKYSEKEIIDKIIQLYPDQAGSETGYSETINSLLKIRKYWYHTSLNLEYLEDDDQTYIQVSLKKYKSILGLSYHPWKWTVNATIQTDLPLTELEICAHVLWELTFYGFTEKQTRNIFK